MWAVVILDQTVWGTGKVTFGNYIRAAGSPVRAASIQMVMLEQSGLL